MLIKSFHMGNSIYFKRLLYPAIFCTLLLSFSACTPGKVASNKKNDASLATTHAYSQDAKVLAKGQQLFQAYCSPCHNFLQKGIGPSLEHVTAAVTPAWLKSFIRNAPEMIEKGDARAKQLFAEYNQLMPPFSEIKEADLDAIVSYIHSQQKAPEVPVAGMGEAMQNPIAEKIAKSGLVLEMKHFTTAPPTGTKPPIARINQMRVLSGNGKDRLFIHDLRGFLYELMDTNWHVALEMKKERPKFIFDPGMGTGFGSFAFHPEFYQNGLFYTTHTEPPGTAPADFAYPDSIKVTLQWVLTEWTIKDPKSSAFSGSSRELLRVNMVTGIHGVQEIAFNPGAKKGGADYGLLYIGIGDGGASENRYPFICHDKSRIWGSVSRIDPSGRNSKNGKYGIPATNPYASMSDGVACREIYCRGFRNPNRYTWAPDGRMLIADIGHINIEELNLAVPGGDYGWPYREGTYVINPKIKMDKVYPLPADDKSKNYLYPVLQFDHDEGKAIEGGFVYTGSALPELKGKYVFGEIALGRVFYVELAELQQGKQATIKELELKLDGKIVTILGLNNGIKPDFRLGVGLNNELFIYTKSDGKVYKIVDCVKSS